MDSTCVSSGFPMGLRVLLVDNDSASLTALEKMLKKCRYEVKSTSSTKEALKMLGEGKDWFQIVMCDVRDGFEFVEHVHKLDLPVIMMSRDGGISKVIRGFQVGACDFLVKPLRLKDVKSIWYHVVRKRLNDPQYSLNELYESIKQTGNQRSREIEFESGAESSSTKKARLTWTDELKNKFVEAVNQIGVDKARPKNILDLMGDASLTRENIASHLQKYRLNLSRAKSTHINSSNSNVQMDHSSVTRQQNVVFPRQNILIHNIQPPYTFSSLPHRFDQCEHRPYTCTLSYHPSQIQLPNTPPPPPPPRANMDHHIVYNEPILFSNNDLNQGVAMENHHQGLDDNNHRYYLGHVHDPPKLPDLESFPYTRNQQEQHLSPRFDFPCTANPQQHVGSVSPDTQIFFDS